MVCVDAGVLPIGVGVLPIGIGVLPIATPVSGTLMFVHELTFFSVRFL